MKFPLVVAATALTAICWGVYGPVLHVGQEEMGGSSLRPFICVGLAYFVIAVIVPIMLLKSQGEKGQWTTSGTIWSLFAGAAGAIGALGIIMAFKFRGSPVYVMPLVFGCAPVVNTFTTMWMSKTSKEAGALFYLGVLIVALGAAGVMYTKPAAKNVHITESDDGAIKIEVTQTADGSTKTWSAKSLDELKTETPVAFSIYQRSRPLSWLERLMIPISIGLTALCWGCYGPTLHQGQMKMSGSRLRPLLCVGLAYFAIAVVVPGIVLGVWNEPGRFFGDSQEFWHQFGGMIWSLAAGAAGAIGALGIIMAFNFGGKPVFVMPLVFGCAPLVNTFTTIMKEGTGRAISPAFMVSLLLAITGAVMVLVFSPKAHPPKPMGGDAKKDAPAAEPAKA